MKRRRSFSRFKYFLPEMQPYPCLLKPVRQLNQVGFITYPLALSVFMGLVLTITVYTILEQLGIIQDLGYWGSFGPFLVIVAFSTGVYLALKHFQNQRYEIGKNDPLFARRLMTDCLERSCTTLDKRLSARPAISLETIFYEMMEDKIFDIYEKDGLRFPDIRKVIEGCGLQKNTRLGFKSFFHTTEGYSKQPLDPEIQMIDEVVYRKRPDLKEAMEKLKSTHKALHTSIGNYLTLLPPDPKKVEKIRKTYRYRPPGKNQAMRLVFAMDAAQYLKAFRFENVKPLGRERYQSVSRKIMPQLAKALNDYQHAWKELVSAYEAPNGKTYSIKGG